MLPPYLHAEKKQPGVSTLLGHFPLGAVKHVDIASQHEEQAHFAVVKQADEHAAVASLKQQDEHAAVAALKQQYEKLSAVSVVLCCVKQLD